VIDDNYSILLGISNHSNGSVNNTLINGEKKINNKGCLTKFLIGNEDIILHYAAHIHENYRFHLQALTVTTSCTVQNLNHRQYTCIYSQ
jgi:hypothetical protein